MPSLGNNVIYVLLGSTGTVLLRVFYDCTKADYDLILVVIIAILFDELKFKICFHINFQLQSLKPCIMTRFAWRNSKQCEFTLPLVTHSFSRDNFSKLI